MPRALTTQEQAVAQQWWPKMNVAAVVVTGPATLRYNCLAWTLGVTTNVIWPWKTLQVTKTEFDDLYRNFGYLPAGSGPIAVFGLDVNDMKHGNVSGPKHGPRWESKCGHWLRLQHGLAEMEGGMVYGNVLGFYARSTAKPREAEVFERIRAMKLDKLSKHDLQFIRDQVRRVPPELRERFRVAYQAWKEACQHPLILISSNPVTRTLTTEFLDLIFLGPEILPLLMEKLTDPDEYLALQAVDRLIRPEFVISRELSDPAILLGEQGRAIETVKQWIKVQA